MSPTFPALAFHRDVGRYAEEDLEKLTHFVDSEDFSTCTAWELKHGQRLGMVVVGPDLQGWKVVGVTDLGVVGSFWGRVLRFLVQQSTHLVDQQIESIGPMTLEQVKDRVAASILANPDDWRDDEAIAGEAGPPREEQDLLDEMVAAVRAAASLPQIIDALHAE
ncbi:hypothetical protein [Phenylobacterium sp.]|jgi:hypothetical protein|uniref:hypothetical protein n=1 Tax=Phenylobacterium sp. TaxID=1871053 RepID=UPI000C8D129C|nr:hypothetical protein [Phenylobacterium sp.]MAK80403.1 hypothetical protein [Phenylobacterium sp.]|tara:strand:- start:6998 stop:7489 length:492 start_codon:yes stop_codon:yes gene_type:complete